MNFLSSTIYSRNFYIRIILAGLLFFEFFGSYYFTEILIRYLVERENRQIQLYAKAMEHTINGDLNENVNFLFSHIFTEIRQLEIPLVYLDENNIPSFSESIPFPENATESQKRAVRLVQLEEFKKIYAPIMVKISEGVQAKIYYGNSFLVKQLRYFPLVQILSFLILGLVTVLVFNYSNKVEQNSLWVGIAKETAHQLGTPISSLTGWLEYLKTNQNPEPDLWVELEKDVKRLQIITQRFSNIGSEPVIKEGNLNQTIIDAIDYLRPRLSTKVTIQIQVDEKINAHLFLLNTSLFEWVIENICKNGVDSMAGVGNLTIKTQLVYPLAVIDISDTGKGILKKNQNKIFKPGFTTKKRGWGLGLALTKKIVEEYHKGKLTLKSSEIGKGTTFRITLPVRV